KAEDELETTFCDFVKQNSRNGAVQRLDDLPTKKGMIRFFPEQLKVRLEGLRTNQSDADSKREGTFRRKVAQERPEIEFFSVGNDFFDAVCYELENGVSGCIYGLECHFGENPWRGFEFVFRIVVPWEGKEVSPNH